MTSNPPLQYRDTGKMFVGKISRLLAIVLATTVASCAVQPRPPAGATADPAQLRHWQIEGKLGFRSPNKNGSAWVNWNQKETAYEVKLNGPFGASSTEIQGTPDFARLSQSGSEDLTAASGEELSSILFGWPFPVTEMPHWIKGVAAPTAPASATYNDLGQLTELEQQQWQLIFSDYQQQGKWLLPSRIKGSSNDYSFTLVIKRWRLDTP